MFKNCLATVPRQSSDCRRSTKFCGKKRPKTEQIMNRGSCRSTPRQKYKQTLGLERRKKGEGDQAEAKAGRQTLAVPFAAATNLAGVHSGRTSTWSTLSGASSQFSRLVAEAAALHSAFLLRPPLLPPPPLPLLLACLQRQLFCNIPASSKALHALSLTKPGGTTALPAGCPLPLGRPLVVLVVLGDSSWPGCGRDEPVALLPLSPRDQLREAGVQS